MIFFQGDFSNGHDEMVLAHPRSQDLLGLGLPAHVFARSHITNRNTPRLSLTWGRSSIKIYNLQPNSIKLTRVMDPLLLLRGGILLDVSLQIYVSTLAVSEVYALHHQN